mgnify:CR=1 FL=1
MITPEELSRYMTGKEVAGYLKIGLSSVDKLINDKHFDGKIQIGRRVLVSKEELDKYIQSRMG